MSKHTLDDLRDHLFATLAALRDADNPMDIARAKAVSDVAQTIINTAKVEADHMRVAGQKHARSSFIALPDATHEEAPTLPTEPAQGTSNAGRGVERRIEERPGVRRTVQTTR